MKIKVTYAGIIAKGEALRSKGGTTKVLVNDRTFFSILRKAPDLVSTIGGIKFLSRISSASTPKETTGYTALHDRLAQWVCEWGPGSEGENVIAFNILTDPKKCAIVSKTSTNDGYSAVESGLSSETAIAMCGNPTTKKILFKSVGRLSYLTATQEGRKLFVMFATPEQYIEVAKKLRVQRGTNTF